MEIPRVRRLFRWVLGEVEVNGIRIFLILT